MDGFPRKKKRKKTIHAKRELHLEKPPHKMQDVPKNQTSKIKFTKNLSFRYIHSID